MFGIRPSGFGLEIEDSILKCIMINSGRKGKKVVSCGVRRIKKGIIQEGEVKDQKVLAEEIKELLKHSEPKPVKSNFVVFSIPESKSFVRTIQIPKMSRDEAEEAIKWETEANIPVSMEAVYLDWQVIGSKESKDEILICAVPKETVDKYYESLVSAGLFPLAGEIDIVATIRSLTSERDKNPVLIADIGADITSLTICKEQVPYFTSSIPLSGKIFTEALRKGLGVSWERAEEIKAKYGIGKMQKDDTLYEIFSPIVENLAREIEKSLVFYSESINPKEEVREIILSGGGALLRQLTGYLTQRLGRKVKLGNPAIGLGIPENLPDELERDICPYATAVGLALRAAQYED